jgi:hypothetical protein
MELGMCSHFVANKGPIRVKGRGHFSVLFSRPQGHGRALGASLGDPIRRMCEPMPDQITASDTWRMQQFSQAYVKAVAAVASCSVNWEVVDVNSIDGFFKRPGGRGVWQGAQVAFQLKSTYADCIGDDHVTFPLTLKNYDDLRSEQVIVPRILIVVVIPADVGEWTKHDETALAMRKCGYWMTIRGAPQTPNTSSKTVHLPRAQVFDEVALSGMFDRVESGGLP